MLLLFGLFVTPAYHHPPYPRVQLAKYLADMEAANGRVRVAEAEARSLQAQLAEAGAAAQQAAEREAATQEQARGCAPGANCCHVTAVLLRATSITCCGSLSRL